MNAREPLHTQVATARIPLAFASGSLTVQIEFTLPAPRRIIGMKLMGIRRRLIGESAEQANARFACHDDLIPVPADDIQCRCEAKRNHLEKSAREDHAVMAIVRLPKFGAQRTFVSFAGIDPVAIG